MAGEKRRERRAGRPEPSSAPAEVRRPAAPGVGRLAVRRARTAYLLAALSALALSLAFPPAEISWLAYLAPVPLLMMAVRTASRRHVFWAGYLGGFIFFGANLHWVIPITAVGWFALVAYTGLYWAVFAWGVRRLDEALRVPLALAAPVLWVALEFVRGWLMTGLPWLYIGHTQYENLGLIQTADALGAYGPGFLVLMTAGFVADVLSRPLVVRSGEGRRVRPALMATGALLIAAWAGTVGYGIWRLGQATTRPGPVVAAIQTSVPQEVKLLARVEQIEALEKRLMDDQLALTREAAEQARAEGLPLDLIVWPETMVPGIQNREFLQADLLERLEDPVMLQVFVHLQARSRQYWRRVQEASAEAGAPILIGAHGVEIEGAYRLPAGGFMTRGPRWNLALVVAPDSPPYADAGRYAKVHLVPFGEYVPFRESWPGLYRYLAGLTPYPYDYSLTAGSADQAPLRVAYDGGEARFQAAICYEDAFAYRVREMVRLRPCSAKATQGDGGQVRPAAGSARKAIDFLVNISNDGWFTAQMGEDPWRLAQTAEHRQHLNLCVFRAIENRIAVVRSVNTGTSAVIASDGRIVAAVACADPKGGDLRGFLVQRIALDDRLAPYTQAGDVFALVCVAASGAGALAAAGQAVRKRKEAKR